MSDLQEIRRFWPWMRASDSFGPKRAFWSRRYRGVQVVVGRMDAVLWAQSGWAVTFCDDRSRQRSKSDPWDGNQFFTGPCHYGPTIAAAMAAAGFASANPGEFADRRQRWLATRFGALRLWGFAPVISGYEPVKLESRQRPRKGVRLGKRGRRLALAASMGEALELVRQKRLDCGEVGG